MSSAQNDSHGTASVLTRRADPGDDRADRQFRALVEATATIVWTTLSTGEFTGRQDGWTAFTGQAEADYDGMGWVEAIHPEDRERSAASWLAATQAMATYSLEHRVRRRDGVWRDMIATAIPVVVDGAVQSWIGTHTDITEQKRLAATLDETNVQFQLLADNMSQLAWMARADGSVFWLNKRWLDFTGLSDDAMIGGGWLTLVHADHAERVRDRFADAIETGRDWEDTFPLRGADGAFRWFLAQAKPVREGETVLRWFGTSTDVTRQRQQEREIEAAREQAENANRAKSEFIANMSHELRTPLSAVIGYAEMLEEDLGDSGSEHLLSDLRKINQNARHLLGLINNVLDLSKIEAEHVEIFPETFHVETTVSEICGTVSSLMVQKRNTLVTDLPDDLGEMHTDQMKLRQCLVNLLSNAAKFSEDGTITLRARRTSSFNRDWITFDVTDTGIGMSPEQLERLFQRFTQADSSTTRRFGGTGLGLAITKAFCKLLGGDIAVTSREGEGTTFTIRLPAIASAMVVETAATRPVPASERAASAGLVLSIDDDPNARELVSRFLTREGFLVRTASDGLMGLEMARAIRPDVILLDVTMPRMDGWSVLSALKGDADLSTIPVVMLTIIDQHSLGYALGASDYLLKPVQWSQLRKVVDRFRTQKDAMVLVVDDDPDHLERTASLLRREGFAVATAQNGIEALEIATTHLPALVLTDLVMPEMDGFALIRALRGRAETAAVPIVVVTSKDLSRQDLQNLRQDTDAVLSKREIELPQLAEQVRILTAAGR